MKSASILLICAVVSLLAACESEYDHPDRGRTVTTTTTETTETHAVQPQVPASTTTVVRNY